MDIVISLNILENSNLSVELIDKRKAELSSWRSEMSYEQFLQEITNYICSTDPSILNSYPVGIHVKTKDIDYIKAEKNYVAHHNKNRFNWEPELSGIIDMLSEPKKNKYTQNEREILIQLCILCGHIDTISEVFRVPQATLKTWLYKAGKRRKNYQYDWYDVLRNASIERRIKILSNGYPIDTISKLTKLSNMIIEKVMSEN